MLYLISAKYRKVERQRRLGFWLVYKNWDQFNLFVELDIQVLIGHNFQWPV